MGDHCTTMIVLYTYQTIVYIRMLLETLHIISSTNIAISNNNVYFIVLNKLAFHILYTTFMLCVCNLTLIDESVLFIDYGLVATFGSNVVHYCVHIVGRIYIHLMYGCQ